MLTGLLIVLMGSYVSAATARDLTKDLHDATIVVGSEIDYPPAVSSSKCNTRKMFMKVEGLRHEYFSRASKVQGFSWSGV